MPEHAKIFNDKEIEHLEKFADLLSERPIEIPPPGGDPQWRLLAQMQKLFCTHNTGFCESQFLMFKELSKISNKMLKCELVSEKQVAFGEVSPNEYFGAFDMPVGINQLANKKITRSPRRFWQFRNVNVIGGASTFSIISDKGVFDPISSRIPAPSDLISPVGAYLENAILTVDRFGVSNISHFLFDCIGRAYPFYSTENSIFDESSFFSGSNPYFLLPQFEGLYQDFVLQKMDIPFIKIGMGEKIKIRNLLVSTEITVDFFDGYSHPAYTGNRQILKGVRNRILRDITVDRSQSNRFFISRSDTNRRPILNEVKLNDWLVSNNIKIICMSSYDPQTQLEIFASADLLVGPHGASLTNLIGAYPGTKVVEYLHPNKATDAYAIISKGLDLDYKYDYIVPGGSNHAGIIDINTIGNNIL